MIISSGIVSIMLILSTLTLFTHTIKTPAFVIGYIFLDIAIVLQIIPWGVLKFKNNLKFLRVPYIIVYGVYLIIQFILFKTVIRMTPMLTMSVVLFVLDGYCSAYIVRCVWQYRKKIRQAENIVSIPKVNAI